MDDLKAVESGLQSEIKAGQFSGDTLTHIQTVLSDITTALSAATASVNGGGSFGSVANAETALRASHLDILDIVNNDHTLSTLATQNGATGFLAAPATLPDDVTAATAPHATLAEIGVIFNDAANRILGGVNSDNKAIITNDMNAVVSGLKHLIDTQPTQFEGLTGIHADTVMRQAQLELTYINQAGVNPDAGRGSNDNILDMIDIIQGDANLAGMASQGGVSGFSQFPDALNPTPRYQDNAAQTNFWANFIAQGNSLGQRAEQLVGSGDTHAINALINEFQAFEKNATKFDLVQGGIFGARFDNELTPSSTLGAEVDAMIKGLKTGDAALVTAAAEVIHDNAADVGGNNIPITGGHFNPDGLTVAEVLSTAVPAPATAATDPKPTPGGTVADAAPTSSHDHATADVHHAPIVDTAHHFHHMWG
ncbi:hypothetical protein [Bosea sp. BIWAKO-01]|uniref:hypothetical protein n=1 Tax=Bosea sp. BIWAKO-01 TaxID=506668 RepID=UPI00086ABA52|nr:hypothetical protein [Bosea sp. BIWAKO-01]GAU84218.1 hypothetical protein BIWAKO_04150 [Bosea sp. BIWAKO-01]